MTGFGPVDGSSNLPRATTSKLILGIFYIKNGKLCRNSAREAMFSRLSGNLPAGRVGTAEDVAHAIWLLLTNTFVTGTILGVDGGHRLAAP